MINQADILWRAKLNQELVRRAGTTEMGSAKVAKSLDVWNQERSFIKNFVLLCPSCRSKFCYTMLDRLTAVVMLHLYDAEFGKRLQVQRYSEQFLLRELPAHVRVLIGMIRVTVSVMFIA